MRVVGVVTLLLVSACGGGTCPEPRYGGKATDEAWRSLVDAEARATVDAAKAPGFSVPMPDQAFPAASAPTFTWASTLVVRPETPGVHRYAAAPPPRSAWQHLSDLVVPSAWAHLAPITGPVHLLRVAVPGRTCPVELVTTQTTWALAADEWKVLTDAKGKTFTLSAVSAYLEQNRVTEGPYRPASTLNFTVSP
ncbi:MAG: hypothetical protein K1X89_23505 [Myxococcaceae bacterium]|nr:hypothetical protein [Myxococcaceae bacterium]